MKNKIILTTFILSVIALVFSGCGGGGTTPPINHSPTITSLTANPQSPIEINQSTVITCSASDPDGDPLTYTWSKTGGTITGTGSAITWTAPSTPGTCTITCIVSDGELTDEQSISIDVEQELPPDITEPELIEIASAKIILDEGGIIEVTNPESEFYGLQLIIEPQKNIKEKEKGLPVTVSISIAYVEGCKLPEYQGFLTTPIIVKSTYIDIICKLKIPYHDTQLLNAGVGKNEPVKACRVLSPPLNWGELPPDEYTTSDNMVSILIGLGDIFYFYTLTVENAIPPDSSRFKDPLPGGLVYKFSKFWPLNINEGWLLGHVGIYVGEKYDEENNKKYNVIEALLGGVTRSHYPDISSFGGNSIYLGAREPKGGLSHLQRNKIVAFVEDAVGTPYSFIDTLSTMFFSGLGRGNLVKGYGSDFNCVGLAEAAYESDGVNVDIVSNYDEGNDAYGAYYILTPAEQWFNTVPATGVIDQNIPPEISNLEVIPEGFIEPNSLVFITCNANDQDQDTLTYIWTIPGYGTYITFTKGKSISWVTPNEEGKYTISCKVIDNYGGEDEKSINISVGDVNHPPEISNLTANPSSIDVNQTSTITCSASDPDDDSLAYTWTKTGGTISGSGSTITWTAPSAAGTYAITCTVSDGNGGEDSESVNIIVKLNDEKEIENIINKIISAISIWDWNEARSYCVYNSPTYYDICELEEQYYNGVLGINYFVDINNIIIINNGYAEVYGDITIIEIINGIISNEQTFNIIGYFQKIGNNWKIYETIPGYNPITYFFKTLRMLA